MYGISNAPSFPAIPTRFYEAVGGFVREPHAAKTQIDGARGELTRFKMRAITQDHDPVEGQVRFRTMPVNELIDGVTITPLCVC